MSALWQAFKPWAGLVAAVAGAAVAHQFGAFGTFDHCPAISPGPLLAVAALCMIVVIAAGWASAQVARLDSESAPRRLAAVISVGMAGLALFATLLPMIASLTLPRCFQ
ncbi:MAG TPA: hypothetical protein VF079_04355 [Sphingomicrobium sp.]